MCLAWGLVMVSAGCRVVLDFVLLVSVLHPTFPFYTSSHSCSHFFLEKNKVSPQLSCVGCKPCLLPSRSWGCSRPTRHCQPWQLQGGGGWG